MDNRPEPITYLKLKVYFEIDIYVFWDLLSWIWITDLLKFPNSSVFSNDTKNPLNTNNWDNAEQKIIKPNIKFGTNDAIAIPRDSITYKCVENTRMYQRYLDPSVLRPPSQGIQYNAQLATHPSNKENGIWKY